MPLHFLSSEQLIERYDTTVPPEFSVGDRVRRIDMWVSDPYNNYRVEAIIPPRPGDTRLVSSRSWYVRAYCLSDRVRYPLTFLAARFLRVNESPSPEFELRLPENSLATDHRIGAPKNKLP